MLQGKLFFSFNNWFIQIIHRIYYNYLQVWLYGVAVYDDNDGRTMLQGKHVQDYY